MSSYADILSQLEAEGNLRSLPRDASDVPAVTDFSSNDYLGIAADTALQSEFFADEDNRCIPFASSASRLLSARQREYERLEALLDSLYGRRTLLFNSGYHANVGMVSALASLPRTLVVADRLVHASIIDGIVLSKARFTRFPHNDYDRLAELIERNCADYDRIIIIAESVYSMDGDCCDVARLAEIRRYYDNTLLYIDEAHAFGVLGPQGLGLCKAAETADYDAVDVIIGTLGKAAASSGAFAVMSDELRRWAINRSRSLIFSTALSPIVCAWSRFVIERMTAMDHRRHHLAKLSEHLADGLGGEPRYIYPYIMGDACATVALSERLLACGCKVLPIRVPTVPAGTERLRISLSAAMSESDIDRLVNAIKAYA